MTRAERRALAAAAEAAKSAAPTSPQTSHKYEIPEEVRAQIETFTPEELAQQKADAAREAAQSKKLDSLLNGGGRLGVDDEADSLDGLDQMSPAAVRDERNASNAFLTSEAVAGAEGMADSFDPLNGDHQQFSQQLTPSMMMIRTRPDDARSVDAPPQSFSDDPLARTIGAKTWRANATFDWCRDHRGNMHHFTRLFQGVNVLYDLYPKNDSRFRAEAEEKADIIRRRNEVAPIPFGYLPVVAGAVVSLDVLEAVRQGGIVELQAGPTTPVRVDTADSDRIAAGDPIAAARLSGETWNGSAAT